MHIALVKMEICQLLKCGFKVCKMDSDRFIYVKTFTITIIFRIFINMQYLISMQTQTLHSKGC